jgi:Predicted pPIWI-associating nuclease
MLTALHLLDAEQAAKTTNQDEWVRAAEAVAMLKPILTEYSARLRICERAHGGLIRARAEQFHYGQRIFHNHDIPKDLWWADGHQALEQDWAAGDFSTWIERGSTQLKAFGVTFARADILKLLPPPNNVKSEAVAHTEEDEQIIDKLDALVPSAALSYKQAVLDLRDDSRVSFRGPALELREALREILDYLAPDSEVTAAPEYVQEKGRTGPTMKQKVRVIMKKKGKRSSSDAPEQAVTAFEEAIAALIHFASCIRRLIILRCHSNLPHSDRASHLRLPPRHQGILPSRAGDRSRHDGSALADQPRSAVWT